MDTKTLTTVDRFGRVVIPKRMRKGLGLSPGSKVAIVKRDYMRLLSLPINCNSCNQKCYNTIKIKKE